MLLCLPHCASIHPITAEVVWREQSVTAYAASGGHYLLSIHVAGKTHTYIYCVADAQ